MKRRLNRDRCSAHPSLLFAMLSCPFPSFLLLLLIRHSLRLQRQRKRESSFADDNRHIDFAISPQPAKATSPNNNQTILGKKGENDLVFLFFRHLPQYAAQRSCFTICNRIARGSALMSSATVFVPDSQKGYSTSSIVIYIINSGDGRNVQNWPAVPPVCAEAFSFY